MRLLNEINGSYAGLTDVQRLKLAECLEARNEYLPKLMDLNRRRVALLKNYTPEAEEAVRQYSLAEVAPLRTKTASLVSALIGDSIDTDGIKSMLPMVLMVLAQSVNVPLLMGTLGLEPEQIDKLTKGASDYFKQGM